MKKILIKLGGSVITDKLYRKTIIEQLIRLGSNDCHVTIVHGGGKLINTNLEKLGIKSEFYEGLRVTTRDVLDVVVMTLAGSVNKDIVNGFYQLNSPAIGLCGGDGALITCRKRVFQDGHDLGYVGVPVKFNYDLYETLYNTGYTLVLSSVAIGTEGYYNVNADYVASFVAQQVKADHLIYVSDVEGVLNPESGQLYSELDGLVIDDLVKTGVITQGMLPKLASCVEALDNGVARISIINGKINDSVFETVVNNARLGTEIVKSL